VTGRVTVTVPDGPTARRADRVVADASGLSRSQVQRLIEEGRLTLDGRPLKSNSLVEAGASLELDVPVAQPSELLAEDIALDVVYQDDDVLVIDKPAGMVTHPAPGHATGTLVNALLGRAVAEAAADDDGAVDEDATPDADRVTDDIGYGTVAGADRPGIVHRLDRDTSGLLLVARNDAAQRALMEQLRARRVKKTYLALVHGSPPAEVGRIEAPIGRDPKRRMRMAVVPDGRPATTGYRVRERFRGWTLLELDLVTGRTHQLRVHLASIGHAIAGDPMYATGVARRGPAGLERLFLHSARLEFMAPSGERLVRVEAPLPPALEQVLDGLRAAHASEPGGLAR
jgi:23S rRNA pseudouridine1911/1915/1917 synthase